MTRTVCSVLCLGTLFLMGATPGGAPTTGGEKAIASGECTCKDTPCDGAVAGGSVPCSWSRAGAGQCSCPANDYVILIDANPRKRACDAAPGNADMACECRCEGVSESPECVNCVTTCRKEDAVPPDPDPCIKMTQQCQCEGCPPTVLGKTCSPRRKPTES